MHKLIIIIFIISFTISATDKTTKAKEIKPIKEVPQYRYTSAGRDPFFSKPNKIIKPKETKNTGNNVKVASVKNNKTEAKDVLKALKEQYVITLLAVTSTKKLVRIKTKGSVGSYREGDELTVKLEDGSKEKLRIELIRGTPASIEFRWKNTIISLTKE